MAFSRHGNQVLTGFIEAPFPFAHTLDANTAKLWDIQTGKAIRTFRGHAGDIYSVSFSPNGEYILTGSRDGTARIWDISDLTSTSGVSTNQWEQH